jgi:hypothetical protein
MVGCTSNIVSTHACALIAVAFRMIASGEFGSKYAFLSPADGESTGISNSHDGIANAISVCVLDLKYLSGAMEEHA